MEQQANADVLDGKFVLLEKLGEGGMGVVYRAYQKDMNRFVAIKLLKSSYSETDRTRFGQEARAIGQLSHPNIVSVYAAGHSSEGHPYLALELLSGKSLADLLASHGARAGAPAWCHPQGFQTQQYLCSGQKVSDSGRGKRC
jgi:serine/threonine-protein kinase